MSWINSIRTFFLNNQEKHWFILFGNFVFGFLYFIIANQSLKLATLSSSVSPIWPPTGFAICIIFIFGRKFLPSVFLGAWLINFLASVNPIAAFCMGVGNMLEAYLGFILLTKIRSYKSQLEHLTTPFAIGAASIIAPLLSATLGVSALYIFGSIPDGIYFNVWLTWWVGDIVGAFLILPFVVAIKDGDFNLLIRQTSENLLKYVLLVLASFFVVGMVSLLLENLHSLKYLFFIFPALIVFTLSSNRLFIYFFGSLIPVMAIGFTVIGKGPFNLSTFNQNLLNLEIFICAVFITNLVLGDIFKYMTQRRVVVGLATGWLFWGGLFFHLANNNEIEDERSLKLLTSEMELRIGDRLNDYLDLMNGARSLFLASSDVNPLEWKEVITSLGIGPQTRGIIGIGAVYRVQKEDVENHFKKYQSYFDVPYSYKSIPESISPHLLPDAKDSFIITFIEPLEPNILALGLDLGSEKNRREGALEAIKTGKPQLTKSITLIQDSKSRPAYLLFVPVFKKGTNPTNEQEREAAFSHWVYAPFYADSFLNMVFDRFKTDIVFEMYESEDYSKTSQVYSNSTEKINEAANFITSKIELAGRTFYVRWAQSMAYETSNDFLSTWIGFFGAMSVLMAVLFTINLQMTGEKAHKLAQKLHDDFLHAQMKMKEQEAKIAEASKMASLGEMASSIAHEINNPLTIIYGKARQIQNYMAQSEPTTLTQKAKDDAAKILTTVDRVSRIIKGLRKISRNASLDSMANVSVKDLIDETLSFCQQRFQQSNIDFRLKAEFTGNIYCRQTEISQVILNLLNNSFDAVLNLPEKWVELKVSESEENLIVTVTDSGKGISKEVQSKIFQPFFTTKEAGKGTGLGLSISKGIIESHFGKFHLDESCPNTRFVISIPLHSQESIKTPAA